MKSFVWRQSSIEWTTSAKRSWDSRFNVLNAKHKFDPITHDDYYGMFAFLNDTHEAQSNVYSEEQLLPLTGVRTEQLKNTKSAGFTQRSYTTTACSLPAIRSPPNSPLKPKHRVSRRRALRQAPHHTKRLATQNLAHILRDAAGLLPAPFPDKDTCPSSRGSASKPRLCETSP